METSTTGNESELEHCPKRIIQPQTLYTCTTLPTAWWQAREKLTQQAQEWQSTTTLETFLQICKRYKIDSSESVRNH